jgi:hypothetical protein
METLKEQMKQKKNLQKALADLFCAEEVLISYNLQRGAFMSVVCRPDLVEDIIAMVHETGMGEHTDTDTDPEDKEDVVFFKMKED